MSRRCPISEAGGPIASNPPNKSARPRTCTGLGEAFRFSDLDLGPKTTTSKPKYFYRNAPDLQPDLQIGCRAGVRPRQISIPTPPNSTDEVASRLWLFKENGKEDFQGPYFE